MQEIISFLKLLITSNTFNFIVMLIILGAIVKKLNLGKSFDGAVDKVKESLKKSDEEKISSQRLIDEAEKLMKQLPQDIETLKNNSKDKASIFKSKIEETTNKTISDIEQNVENAVQIEEKKISNLMCEKTSKASVELAKQYILETLDSNPNLHNKFFMESLEELDKVKL